MRRGKPVKYLYCFEAHDDGQVLLLASSGLVAWVQCCLSSAAGNICKPQRAYAVRNQRRMDASPETSLKTSACAPRYICSAACRAGWCRASPGARCLRPPRSRAGLRSWTRRR